MSYLEDMLKRLVLRPPVEQIVPVVGSSHLLLRVHNAEIEIDIDILTQIEIQINKFKTNEMRRKRREGL